MSRMSLFGTENILFEWYLSNVSGSLVFCGVSPHSNEGGNRAGFPVPLTIRALQKRPEIPKRYLGTIQTGCFLSQIATFATCPRPNSVIETCSEVSPIASCAIGS